ncbi:MAG: Cna B-type domain-containing protein, partial [Bacteroidales bacterium]|nr:Cna B-type domain-containing protein [Bacteroidales bacterium]
TWIDPEGTKHPTITINLLREREKVDSKTLADGVTGYAFANLPKYDLTDGHVYEYTVEEEAVAGYTSEQNGTNFTNTIAQDNSVVVSGTKTWIDPEGTEHPEITINLLRDGTEVNSTTLANGTVSYAFENLPKYDLTDGHVYVYTVKEEAVEGYTSVQKGTNFTNTIAQDNSVAVRGTKTWIDPEGTKHPTITINLLRDGVEVASKTLADGTVVYAFENLPKYDLTDGHVYAYTVEEEAVAGYTSTQNGTNFTNTIAQDNSVVVSGSKTWIDPAGTEHPAITINLLRDGEKIDSRTLENGTVNYVFENLSKYDLTDGHVYEYTVEEEAVEGYTSTQNGTNFTNTIKQDTSVVVSGRKTWIDPAGTEHPTITINLLRDGKKVDSKTLENGTVTYTFANLPKYDLTDGHVYAYTVEEEAVDGYSSVREGNNFRNTINQDGTVSVSGTKTWIDPEGTEHPEITINLLRDGTKYDSKILADGVTSYSFTNLEKYDLTDGHVYVYTVEEEKVSGYTSARNGNNFVNTIAQDNSVRVSGSKTWIDPEGTEHPAITINLLRDGKKVSSKTLVNGVTDYAFENLPKYDLSDGHVYEYTVEEEAVEGYTSVQNGTNFTNTIAQDMSVVVSGTKTWIDPEGTEHPTVTINLLRDGDEVDSRTIANGEVSYTFSGLPKYDLTDGHVYVYTVKEEAVEGYTSVQNGTNFTNTIEQDNSVVVSGTKTWIDPEGTEHPAITINLLRDGTKYDSKILA